MLGKLIGSEEGTLVHEHSLAAGQGKFLIKNVYLQNCIKFWREFEKDKHSPYKAKPDPPVPMLQNPDLLTDSEASSSASEAEDEGYKGERQMTPADLNNSQILMLLVGDEVVGKGLYVPNGSNPSDTVPVTMTTVKDGFKKNYQIGRNVEWMSAMRTKKEIKRGKVRKKIEWKKVKSKRLKTSGKGYTTKSADFTVKERREKVRKNKDCHCQYTVQRF